MTQGLRRGLPRPRSTTSRGSRSWPRQAVAELRAGGAARSGPAREARQRARSRPRLADELASPDHQVLVGTLDDAILGYGVGRGRRLPDGGRLGVVTDLYVEPGGRGSASGRR